MLTQIFILMASYYVMLTQQPGMDTLNQLDLWWYLVVIPSMNPRWFLCWPPCGRQAAGVPVLRPAADPRELPGGHLNAAEQRGRPQLVRRQRFGADLHPHASHLQVSAISPICGMGIKLGNWQLEMQFIQVHSCIWNI
jgi:hypothetical protein